MALAALGAQVMLSDRPEVVPLLERNVASNLERGVMDKHQGSVAVCSHLWGEPFAALGAPFDMVCACDCVYDVHLVAPLIASLLLLSGSETQVFVAFDESVGRT